MQLFFFQQLEYFAQNNNFKMIKGLFGGSGRTDAQLCETHHIFQLIVDHDRKCVTDKFLS